MNAFKPITKIESSTQLVTTQSSIESFLIDLKAMCQLIEEATKYGTTVTLESEYLALRKNLSAGYRFTSTALGDVVVPLAGFHGCGFEMILGHYSLDALCQAAPRRTVALLREVNKTIENALVVS